MISIIIVTYNNEEEIEDCLNSIKEKITGVDYEVIIIDNQSKDKTRKIIKEKYSWVNLIEAQDNLGFAKGNNKGAQGAKGKFLFFLNPDTIVINNVGKIIKKIFKKHPKAGIIGIRQLDKTGKDRPENIGVDPNLYNLVTKFVPRKWDYNKNQEVKQVSGASLAIRKNIFDKLKGFDPDFFMYLEDYDLCFRTRKKGWKVFYNAKGKIYHLCGKSFTSNIKKKKFYYKSQDLFYDKHYSSWKKIIMQILRFPIKFINTHTF